MLAFAVEAFPLNSTSNLSCLVELAMKTTSTYRNGQEIRKFGMSFQEGLLRDLQTLTAQKEALRLDKSKASRTVHYRRQRFKPLTLSRRSPFLAGGHANHSKEDIYVTSGNEATPCTTQEPKQKLWNIRPPAGKFFGSPVYMDFTSYPGSVESPLSKPWIPPASSLDLFDIHEFNQIGSSNLPDSCHDVIIVPTRTLDGSNPNFMCGTTRYWKPKKHSVNPLAKRIDAFYMSTFLRALRP